MSDSIICSCIKHAKIFPWAIQTYFKQCVSVLNTKCSYLNRKQTQVVLILSCCLLCYEQMAAELRILYQSWIVDVRFPISQMLKKTVENVEIMVLGLKV
jgi:hypothetical protein